MNTMSQLRTMGLALTAAAVFALAATAFAAESGDEAEIAHAIKSVWDTAGNKVTVAPVAVSGSYAVAGWIVAGRGGRALLRKGEGWSVVLCSGDGIRTADGLQSAGVPGADAERLSKALAAGEAKLPAEHVARFSAFEGTVEVGPGATHAPHAPHPPQHVPSSTEH